LVLCGMILPLVRDLTPIIVSLQNTSTMQSPFEKAPSGELLSNVFLDSTD
jgi:hypothetical protein